MKVLVCGGSGYRDRTALFACLDDVHAGAPVTQIINGGARGADLLASQWARERGIELSVFTTNRQRHGPDAFLELNGQMLEKGQPDFVIAFPGGGVTADLIARARAGNIPVRIVG